MSSKLVIQHQNFDYNVGSSKECSCFTYKNTSLVPGAALVKLWDIYGLSRKQYLTADASLFLCQVQIRSVQDATNLKCTLL